MTLPVLQNDTSLIGGDLIDDHEVLNSFKF